MSEIEFIDGLIVKEPSKGVPDFVKAGLSIKRDDLIVWLQGRDDEWINADIKVARSGKWYAAVNDWKPDNQQGQSRQSNHRDDRRAPSPAPAGNNSFDDDDVPF